MSSTAGLQPAAPPSVRDTRSTPGRSRTSTSRSVISRDVRFTTRVCRTQSRNRTLAMQRFGGALVAMTYCARSPTRDSNPAPLPYRGSALPSELDGHGGRGRTRTSDRRRVGALLSPLSHATRWGDGGDSNPRTSGSQPDAARPRLHPSQRGYRESNPGGQLGRLEHGRSVTSPCASRYPRRRCPRDHAGRSDAIVSRGGRSHSVLRAGIEPAISWLRTRCHATRPTELEWCRRGSNPHRPG